MKISRLWKLLGGGLGLVLAALAVQVVATGALAGWRAAQMSDASLSTAAARPAATFPTVMEWARRLERQGQLAEASRSYARATHLSPAEPEAWVAWGRTAYAAGDWKDADAVLAATVKQWPHDADARFAFGALLTSTLRFRRSRDELAA